MPNFPPGTPQSLAPAVTPTQVSNLNPSAKYPSVRFFNTSTVNPVYIGGPAVSQFNGMPLYPGNRPIQLQDGGASMYVCSGATRGAASGTLGSASTAGTTTVTLSTTVPTSLAAGTTVMIGSTANTSSFDVNVVATTTASSALTFASPLLYDHATSTVVYAATANIGSISITQGSS